MGLHINVAVVLRSWALRHAFKGPLVALGVQDVTFSAADYATAIGQPALADLNKMLTAKDLYRDWGVHEAVHLDVSAYEGAEILFDLNQPDLPSGLAGRFGVVLNGGTLEHVFHVPNALTNITRLLDENGVVIHLTPAHNWLDHGFYQISTTLLFDYYEDAGFTVLESAGLVFQPSHSAVWDIVPAPRGAFGTGMCGVFDGRAMLHAFVARRGATVNERPIPTQYLYQEGGRLPSTPPRWFPPFQLENGRTLVGQPPAAISLGSFRKEVGMAWTVQLPGVAGPGDTQGCWIQSGLALFENDRLLGPPHSSHDRVRHIGLGAYSHWGDTLYMSTTDGSDPNTNGRCYVALIPTPLFKATSTLLRCQQDT